VPCGVTSITVQAWGGDGGGGGSGNSPGTSGVGANASPFYQNYAYNYNSADYITYNAMGSLPPSAFDGFVAGLNLDILKLNTHIIPALKTIQSKASQSMMCLDD